MRTLLIRRRRPTDEPSVALIQGTVGAGRIVTALLELGVPLDTVRQAPIDPERSIDELVGLDLDGPYERVALASHLVNTPDGDRREALLQLAARNVAPGGTLLVEHHPLDWARTAAPTPPTPGGAPGMIDVRRHAPFVSAVSVYDLGGRVARQPFTARVLSTAELTTALAAVGFAIQRRLGPTWVEAGRSRRRSLRGRRETMPTAAYPSPANGDAACALRPCGASYAPIGMASRCPRGCVPASPLPRAKRADWPGLALPARVRARDPAAASHCARHRADAGS